MYNEQSKIALEGRIGWSNPIPPNTEITLTLDNDVSFSGRYFNSYHQLVIVENVYLCINNIDISNDDFNEYIAQMRIDCVNEVLNKIFDTNILAKAKSSKLGYSLNFKQDYSDDILNNLSLFDDCIGYCMSVKCLQMFITSTRSNGGERQIAQSYEFLKSELEGFRNNEGVVVANGVNSFFEASISNVIEILFPIKETKKSTLSFIKIW